MCKRLAARVVRWEGGKFVSRSVSVTGLLCVQPDAIWVASQETVVLSRRKTKDNTNNQRSVQLVSVLHDFFFCKPRWIPHVLKQLAVQVCKCNRQMTRNERQEMKCNDYSFLLGIRFARARLITLLSDYFYSLDTKLWRLSLSILSSWCVLAKAFSPATKTWIICHLIIFSDQLKLTKLIVTWLVIAEALNHLVQPYYHCE